MTKPDLNQTFDITIDDLGISGEGVGRLDGFTVFIDGALPGERVQAELFHSKKHYGRARLLTVYQASPLRVEPPCPLFKNCGGCQLMHLGYTQQLEFKKQRIEKALRHIGKIEDIAVEPCLPSPLPLGYRNKIQLLAAPSEEGVAIGLYARHSHDVVSIDKCYIHCSQGEEVFKVVSKIVKESGVVPYDAESGKGELRHILIKTAIHTKESLVVFVTNGPISARLKQVAEKVMLESPAVKGVVQNINTARSNVILGREYHLLRGVSAIDEELCGLRFKISAASFFQVNPLQAENLYKKALEFAGLSKSDIALDAYCGVGTLSLLIAREAKRVIGVENVPEAISDANSNASMNKVDNVTFVCADTENYLNQCKKKIDVIFLNPPRKGCEESVINSIGKIKPSKVIYISCDPATLARDVGRLCSIGYKLKQVQPYDMFPQTAHVECVVQLEYVR